MAKKDYEGQLWTRQANESSKAYEAFSLYRDMGRERTLPKVAEACGKSVSLMNKWSQANNWVERVRAYDDEVDRQAAQAHLADIAKARARQRKLAASMQGVGIELLQEIRKACKDNKDNPALRDVVQLLKTGMEQERICMGDVGEVIEERNGGDTTPAVQIYIPDNGRGNDRDNFEDIEV